MSEAASFDFLPDGIEAKPAKSKAPKNTPIKKILNQISLNPDITQKELAERCNVSRQAVSQMLIRYGIDDKCLESFKKSRADIFAGIQETVAASFTPEDIKKASFKDRVVAMGILYDKERLERGESTQNISVRLASAVLDAEQDAPPID
jgi:predicted DNA-binding protein YlxM (UPF0122 family)